MFHINKTFHQLAPLIALKFMPDSFKSFLICSSYSVEQLQIDADLPDLVDHDNIENDPLCRHGHSYKMEKGPEGNLVLIEGDALERVVGLCEDAHDFHQEQKLDLVRYCLGKMTHYAIDGTCTYPHQHRGKPWNLHHQKFEDEMGRFITKHHDEVDNIDLVAYKEVHDGCQKTAKEMWPIGQDIVQKYELGTPLTDEDKMFVLRICVQVIGDLWLTVAKELKL